MLVFVLSPARSRSSAAVDFDFFTPTRRGDSAAWCRVSADQRKRSDTARACSHSREEERKGPAGQQPKTVARTARGRLPLLPLLPLPPHRTETITHVALVVECRKWF